MVWYEAAGVLSLESGPGSWALVISYFTFGLGFRVSGFVLGFGLFYSTCASEKYVLFAFMLFIYVWGYYVKTAVCYPHTNTHKQINKNNKTKKHAIKQTPWIFAWFGLA